MERNTGGETLVSETHGRTSEARSFKKKTLVCESLQQCADKLKWILCCSCVGWQPTKSHLGVPHAKCMKAELPDPKLLIMDFLEEEQKMEVSAVIKSQLEQCDPSAPPGELFHCTHG